MDAMGSFGQFLGTTLLSVVMNKVVGRHGQITFFQGPITITITQM